MQSFSPRQQQIIALARQTGNVSVDELAQRFEVTPQTIRKDLNDICDARVLARTHGGAMVSSGVENLAYEARRKIAATEKMIIGRHAASLIPNDCSLFINIGTTTEEVARALRDHTGLLVITNNIHVASMLMSRPSIDVILAGGKVRKSDGGIVGEATADFINQFKVDYAVIGTSAIDEDGSILDFDYREVRVAKAIIGNARRVMLVADLIKFERSAPVRICSLSEMDVFVTDRTPPEAIVNFCRENNVEMQVADDTTFQNSEIAVNQ